MDFYQVNLVAFVLLNGSMVYQQYKKEKAAEISEKLLDCDTESLIGDANIPRADSATAFTKTFFPVYVLVWAADWLQGPFIYTLYKDEKQLPEEIVARLFTTGFLAGAVSALFVGSLADRFGRRAACMLYCVITILSCVTVLSDNTSILFFGRALGGLGTTLMYTVFEAWMVAEYNHRGLERTSLKLSTIFGRMTTLSSVVAVLSGLVGQGLVSYTKTNCAPFIASVCCLVPAALFIWIKWTENFGDNNTSHKTGPSLRLLLGVDKQVLALGLISCCFEGAMYLFIFFWSPALKSAHKLAGLSGTLPFGTIFANFMGALMLGSMLFTIVMTSKKWLTCREILQTVVCLASLSLLFATLLKNEYITFWLFCLFEACVGTYFPSMGYQKGKVVDDGNRAHIYGILRVPYNIFVVVALGLTKEGDQYREFIFMCCSGLLLLASAVINSVLHD